MFSELIPRVVASTSGVEDAGGPMSYASVGRFSCIRSTKASNTLNRHATSGCTDSRGCLKQEHVKNRDMLVFALNAITPAHPATPQVVFVESTEQRPLLAYGGPPGFSPFPGLASTVKLE